MATINYIVDESDDDTNNNVIRTWMRIRTENADWNKDQNKDEDVDGDETEVEDKNENKDEDEEEGEDKDQKKDENEKVKVPLCSSLNSPPTRQRAFITLPAEADQTE